ncbi:MAG: leucyl/phenylalanyl-tRNA--protein transferase [Schleiferiaceae bacterium]|nr:leucyl/phenylalanyl-tRNA--protein transferase [Schleiferiaceae bacterium]
MDIDYPHELSLSSPHRRDGLVAIGGTVHPSVLIEMYSKGIFPWFEEGEVPLWYSPDPRMVIFVPGWQPKRSLRQVLRKNKFTVTINTDFESVMRSCGAVYRKGQAGTWIHEDLIASFLDLHQRGFAMSVEVWHDRALVGGLYGVVLGKVYFGESMFHTMTDASKVGFAHLISLLQKQNFAIVDCQVYTDHLASLGAVEIPKGQFEQLLETYILPFRTEK